MKSYSRIIVAVVAIVMISAYFLPIWEIDLEAPQYPEGLGMKIWINKLSGDINTINGLNHYIGMKKIEENSIPELMYMPYCLGFIIGLGLLTAFVGKKWLLYVWVFLFGLLGLAGGIDFYLWEYDYGHDLDPRAAIKIPGMNYQPPLWGSKQLLNFNAHSYPDWGGIIILVAGAIAFILLILNLFSFKKNNKPKHSFSKSAFIQSSVTFFIFSFLFVSCSAEPEPLNYGTDACDHCKMTIVDEKFGAEMVSDKGKIFKFDATECMVNFYNNMDENKKNSLKYYLVADTYKKGNLIEVNKAYFLLSESLPSPMGGNLSAFSSLQDAQKFQKEYQGEIISWNQVEKALNN